MKGSASEKTMVVSALSSLMHGEAGGTSRMLSIEGITTYPRYCLSDTRTSSGTKQRKRRKKARQLRGGGK